MDFTTKKILNNGRYILSIISEFLNVITYFIIPHFNANVATKVVQNNFQRTFLSKSESSTLSASLSPSSPLATTTTRRRRRTRTPSTFSSTSESSRLAPSPPSSAATTTTIRTKTTRTPSISKSESSTLAAPLSATTTTTTRTKTTRTPSIWKFESSTSTPPPQPSTTTTRGTTIRLPSIFSSKSESTSTPPPPPLALPLLSPTKATTTTPSTFSSLFDSTPYSSPWMYSTSGDLIGSESGVFMASPSELEEYEQQYRNRKPKTNIPKKGKQPKNMKKEYPPPIPSWRGTLPRDVQWSLSRHNVDGRLILKEETMEYYEYLEATRENGRLVLKLIVLKGYKKYHDQNDFDDTIHEDEITRDETINRMEKKKRIQEEAQKESKMINRDIGIKKEEAQKESKMINRDIGIKKRRGHY